MTSASPAKSVRGKSYARFLVLVGYILSPLSWWNDPFVNIPLSYAFAVPFAAIDRRLLVPMMALGYWLSNVLGLLLMHHGTAVLMKKQEALPVAPGKGIRKALMVSLLYTLLIVLLAQLGIVRFPTEYLNK